MEVRQEKFLCRAIARNLAGMVHAWRKTRFRFMFAEKFLSGGLFSKPAHHSADFRARRRWE